MSSEASPEIAAADVGHGSAGARRSWDKALVAGFVAGAYVAVAGLLAIVVSAGLDPKIWGNVHTLLQAAVFSIGLLLLVSAAPPWALPASEPLSPPAVPRGAPEAARSR
jgi:formate/nitrite transporter FocA (FNT family)